MSGATETKLAGPLPEDLLRAEVTAEPNSYGQILHSSFLTAVASGATMATAIIRTKANALMLGPSGIGLFGLFNSIFDISSKFSNLGVFHSGVRQIAEAMGRKDETEIAETVATMRLLTRAVAVLGAVALFLLRGKIARLTFGNTTHATDIGVLAGFLFFDAITSGHTALLQGTRRVGLLARRNIAGAVLGTIASITIIYWLRQRGVALSLVAVSAMLLLSSWFFTRKVRLPSVSLGWAAFWAKAWQILALGFVFMVTFSMVAAVGYLNRWILSLGFGLEAVGLYQSATNLSILYPTFIFQAMGMDFYPRLTAVAADHPACNRLINEQTEIGLLLAMPGILATLAFTPLLVRTFYSSNFAPAVIILRWQVLGVFLQVATWPMAYVVLAKGMKLAMCAIQAASTIVTVGLFWLCTRLWGLPGAGIGFFALFMIYSPAMALFIRRTTGFRWSPAILRLAACFAPAVALCFLASSFLPAVPAVLFGSAVTIGVSLYNLRVLHQRVGLDRLTFLPKKLREFVGRRLA